jgi:hypothetical protein
MIKYSKLFALILYSFVLTNFQLEASIEKGTLIATINGLTSVENLNVGDKVISYNQDNASCSARIIRIKKRTVSAYYKIELNSEYISISTDHLFFDPIINKWIPAHQLTLQNTFLDASGNAIPCTNHNLIELLDKPLTFYEISLEYPHIYYISSSRIMTHNFFPFIIGCSIAFGLGDGLAITGIGCGFGALGLGLWKTFTNDPNKINIHILQSGTKDKEDKLPTSGEIPFEPQKTKNGKIPRDRQGGFIDKHGRSWRWDPKKNEWDVQINGGRRHLNVNPQGNITH